MQLLGTESKQKEEGTKRNYLKIMYEKNEYPMLKVTCYCSVTLRAVILRQQLVTLQRDLGFDTC